jgi:PAS domain S-box-containing protein
MSLESPSWRQEREIKHPHIKDGAYRLQFVSDSVPALLSYIDPDCRYRLCNQAYSDWFGLARDEVIGKPMWDVLGDEAWKTLEPHVREVLTGHATQFETRAKYKTGGIRWIQVSYTPDLDDRGQVLGFAVLVTDISDHKRTEEALRQSEQFSRTIIESSHDCIKIVSLDGHLLWMSDAGQRILCIEDVHRHIGKSWINFWQGEDRVNARKAVQAAALGGSGSFIGLFRVRNEPKWWEVVVSPIMDLSGKPEKLLAISRDVTERKRTDEALRESEERLRLFIEHAPAAIAMFDRDIRYLAASNRWKTDYDLPGEIVGRSHYELFPELPERWKAAHRRAVAGEVLRADADTFPRADGSTQWVKWEVRPWHSASGEIGGILIATEDVTANVLAKNALQESERRFRSFVEATAHVIWRTNARGEVDQSIPSWNAFTGQSDPEAAGFGWMSAVHPDDRADVAAAWQRASAAKGTYQVEYRLKIHTGEWRHVRARGIPVFDAAGNVAEYIGTCIDVTERQLAEEHFQLLAENIPQLAWMVNADGWIFWFNKRWYEYTGTTLEQMRGWGWQAVHHPDHTERVTTSWLRSVKSGDPWEDTFPLRAKDGTYRWFLSRAFPIHDANGHIYRWFGTNTDITELRDAQDALQKAEEELRFHAENLERTIAQRTAALRESNEQMEAFTYTIAHDLRAPLRGQQGFASALLDEHGPALGESGREYAGRIIDSAARMNDLINDLLAYSRLSRTEIQIEKVDLQKLVLEIRDEMTFQIRDANAKVHVDPFDFIVCAHPVTLRAAIQNLVGNALKFTRPGVPPEVGIRAETRGQSVRLWVEDNGIGIAPEHHRQIFGVFHRLHKIGQYSGTGVGLAIVQKGIERMGGRTGVESEECRGSRFWIELDRPE